MAAKLRTVGVGSPSTTTSSLEAIATGRPLAGVMAARPERRVVNDVRSGVTSTR